MVARRVRITIVEPLGTGGMIHYAYQLASALTEAGASVTLLTSGDYELESLPHRFRLDPRLQLWPHFDGGPVARGSVLRRASRTRRRVGRALRLLRAWTVVLRALDPRETDVVQFGTLRFPFETMFLRLLRRRGFVLADVCHEPELRERGGGTIRRLAVASSRAAYASFDAVFVHGEHNHARFSHLFPAVADRASAIEHGNEDVFHLLCPDVTARRHALRSRYGIDEGRPVVLFFGHIVPSKGLDVLVRAHALSVDRTAAKLVVAGYPSKLFDVAALEALVRELGVEDSVVLDLRYVPGSEVAPLLEIASVVALPYLSASQSGALQVAYSFGRAVVASAVGGLPEVVEDGKTGVLVPPGAPDELAQALEAILADPGRAASMGAYARELSQTRFSWHRPAESILSTYVRLLEARAV